MTQHRLSRGLLLTGVVSVAVAVSAAQEPVFRARIEGVRVDVLVTERGRPVVGLEPGDFEVRDNGVPQTIDLVKLGDVPVAVVLALDLSSSVRGAKLAALKRAGHALVDALEPSDDAALITFNTPATLRIPLGRELDRIRQTLDGATSVADTSVVDASLAAMLLGDSDSSRTLIVVFSDGVDTASFIRPEQVLETARRVNGVVYGVSTRQDDSRFLRDLAEATGGRVLQLTSADDPAPAFLEILQEFRRRYVVTFTPTGVPVGGWHTLDVRVKRRGPRVQARSGYYSAQP